MKRTDFTWISSLGCCCETTLAIRAHNKTESSIFDWLFIHKLKDVYELIENNFDGVHDLHRGFIPHTTNDKLQIKTREIFVVHYDEDEWRKKCNYRIPRLYTKIKEKDAFILFVWKSHLNNQLTQEQWDEFVKCIYNINPNLKYYALLINEFKNEDNVFEIIHDNVFYKLALTVNNAIHDHTTIYACNFINSHSFWDETWKEFDEWLLHKC